MTIKQQHKDDSNIQALVMGHILKLISLRIVKRPKLVLSDLDNCLGWTDGAGRVHTVTWALAIKEMFVRNPDMDAVFGIIRTCAGKPEIEYLNAITHALLEDFGPTAFKPGLGRKEALAMAIKSERESLLEPLAEAGKFHADLYAGVWTCLNAMRVSKIAIGLVTSSSETFANWFANFVQVAEFLSAIIGCDSADIDGRCKPKVHPWIICAALMGYDLATVGHFWVFEDSLANAKALVKEFEEVIVFLIAPSFDNGLRRLNEEFGSGDLSEDQKVRIIVSPDWTSAQQVVAMLREAA